jgi:hypothetical protein
MAIKSYVLSGTIEAGAAWKRIAELTTPSGVTRKLIEIRPYISATSGVQIKINLLTEVYMQLTAEVVNAIKYPYPADLVAPEGMQIVLEAMNPTASSATIVVELIVDETVRK